MKNYKKVTDNKRFSIEFNCSSYPELIYIYETKYQDKYQLIGYSFNRKYERGELVLCPRE
jgi:hypothetical protein